MKRILAVVVLLLSTGCASVGVTRLKEAVPKPDSCALEVFTGEADIKRPFEVVCLLDSRTGTTALHSRSGSTAIELAKPKACQCGADGIIVQAIDTEGMGMAGWGMGKAVVKAIRFTGPQMASP